MILNSKNKDDKKHKKIDGREYECRYETYLDARDLEDQTLAHKIAEELGIDYDEPVITRELIKRTERALGKLIRMEERGEEIKEMRKVHLVYESWGTCDDESCVGAFLDEQKADEYIAEHMIPRNKEEEQHEKCKECRCCDKDNYYSTHAYDEVFLLEDKCPIAKIGTDRNGKYCENDISEYYSLKTNAYWKISEEIIG